MNMIEKVARAIHNTVSQTPFEQCNQVYQKAYFIKARVAIEAMREVPDVCYDNYRCDNLWRDMDSRTVWLTWIDAALKENKFVDEIGC